MGFISKANGEKLNLNDIVFEDINGDIFSLKDVNSKLILIVNTASFCDFTKQYAHLQSLNEKYDLDQLLIIAVLLMILVIKNRVLIRKLKIL